MPYGVTNTSVAASRSESSSIERNRSSNSTWSPSPSSSTRRSSISRYRSPSRRADVRMRAAGDRVDDLRVPLDHRRQRLDHRLQALAGRDQAERGEQERRAVGRRSRSRCLTGSRAARSAIRAGAPCGTTRTFSSGQAPDSTSSRSAVSVITITSSASRAQLREHLRLVRRRLRQHRVQRHDERLRQFLRERQHVLAVAAAEDPVLVLEQHDVDIEPPEHPGRPDVVAAHRLRDRREHAPPLRARRLVHDRDEIGDRHRAPAGQRRAQVGCEGADPAGPRRVRGDDRRPHALTRRPCSRRGAERLHPLRLLQTAAHRRRFAESVPPAAERSRSSTRFRRFLMMSLPLVTPPKQQAAGSCGSQNTGTLHHTVAQPGSAQIRGLVRPDCYLGRRDATRAVP